MFKISVGHHCLPCVSYFEKHSVNLTQFIKWLICLYTLLVLLTERVCLFLGLKPQYILVLMASFLFVLLRGFGGQDGMINQPLTDKLIHCRVRSRTTIEIPVSSAEFEEITHTMIFNTAFCLIHGVKQSLLWCICAACSRHHLKVKLALLEWLFHVIFFVFIHGGDDCAHNLVLIQNLDIKHLKLCSLLYQFVYWAAQNCFPPPDFYLISTIEINQQQFFFNSENLWCWWQPPRGMTLSWDPAINLHFNDSGFLSAAYLFRSQTVTTSHLFSCLVTILHLASGTSAFSPASYQCLQYKRTDTVFST